MCTVPYNRNVLHTNVRKLFGEIETKENEIVPLTKDLLEIQKRKMFSFQPVIPAGKKVQKENIRSIYWIQILPLCYPDSLLMNVHNVLHYMRTCMSKTVIGLPENWRRLSSSVITISSNTHAHTHCYFISAKWQLLKSVTAFYGCQAIIIFFSLPFYEAHGFHI